MKNLSIRITSFLFVAGLFASSALAQTLNWDPGLTDSSGGGGAGTWSTGANWFNGTADAAWVTGDIATFGGTAGTVTLSAAETADGLTFNTAGYTLGGSSTLTLANSPTITIPSGTTTISAKIAGTTGLALTGPGTLVLSAANTYTGGTTIAAGSTLQLQSYNSASTGPIAITGNGTLFITNGAAASAADAVVNTITGGSSSVITVEVNAANFYFYPNLANFTGTVNVTNSSVPTSASLVLEAPGPFAMVAPGTWNICTGAEIYDNDGQTISANIIINGPGATSATTAYGALRLQNGNITGKIQLAGTGANVNNNQIGNTAAGPFTLSGVISDAGGSQGLNFVGAPAAPATIILSGLNTYGGPTTFTSNSMRAASVETPGVSGPFGTATAAGSFIFPAGGTLQFSSVNRYDYSSRFSSAASQHYSVDVNGQSCDLCHRAGQPRRHVPIKGSWRRHAHLKRAEHLHRHQHPHFRHVATGLGGNPWNQWTIGHVGGIQSGVTLFLSGGTLQFTSVNQNDYSGPLSARQSAKPTILMSMGKR